MSRFVYLRYIVASVGALGLDMALFMASLALGTAPVMAAGLGYAAGIGAHWLMSSRAVFSGRLARKGNARRQQQALFLLSALVGLALTMTIVGLGNLAHGDPRLAKLAAIAVSFQATYLLRRKIVFA
ncbi:MAG TPA: GtrA family protein [Allosphingosinicella sp.]|nr:GtrA family protein [Allosphingosinicella sp.]